MIKAYPLDDWSNFKNPQFSDNTIFKDKISPASEKKHHSKLVVYPCSI